MPFGLFGKKKGGGGKAQARAAPNANDTIQNLRGTIETLEKREAHLEKKCAGLLKQAKAKQKKKDKRGAINLLKQKKLYQGQLDGLAAKKLNIETQIMNLENAMTNKDVMNAMVGGKNALQNEMKAMDVEKVDDVMDELAEINDMQNEINEALAGPMGDDYDEDELADELAELEDELEDEEEELEAQKAPAKVQKSEEDELRELLDDDLGLPDAPTDKPKPKPKEEKTQEEAEMDELNALIA